jgi:hypothetical protein
MSESSDQDLLRAAFRGPSRTDGDALARGYRTRSRVAKWGARAAFAILGTMLSLALASEPRVMAQIERGMKIWKGAPDGQTVAGDAMTDADRAEARSVLSALFAHAVAGPNADKPLGGDTATFTAQWADSAATPAKPLVSTLPASRIPVRRGAGD